MNVHDSEEIKAYLEALKCYMKDSNLNYLSKVENLDFLGGEE